MNLVHARALVCKGIEQVEGSHGATATNEVRLSFMARDFDDNEFPVAYLITFRCYGTWVHGDDRTSTDRRHNVYSAPKIAPNKRLQTSDAKQLKHPPQHLDAARRQIVENAVREVCEHRQYVLRAFNVRTNHVHTVVTALRKPEPVLIAFQAYSRERCGSTNSPLQT